MANTTSLSGFPATIDSFDRVSDLDEETLAKSEIYKDLINNGDYDDAEQYLEDNPDLAQCAINAAIINKHSDSIVALENETVKKKNNYFGVCSSLTSSDVKTVSINGGNFILEDGVEVTVRFLNDFGSPVMSLIYLNVEDTANVEIHYKGNQLPGGFALGNDPYYLPSIQAEQIVTFKYFGGGNPYWNVIGNLDNAGSCLMLGLNSDFKQYTPAKNNLKTINITPDSIGAAIYQHDAWTPQLLWTNPNTGNTETASTSAANGNWYVIGGLCYFTAVLTVSSTHSASLADLYIKLPKKGNGTNVGVVTWNYSGSWLLSESTSVDVSQNYSTHCYCVSDSTNGKLKVMANNNIAVQGFISGASLIVSGWYIISP